MLRVAILCNDRLALPALHQLVQSKLAIAVGTTDRASETQVIIRQTCAQANTPVQLFTKTNFEEQLSEWLLLHQPDVVLVKTFPWRIPEGCLKMPRHGFINFHYAPLPEWRGSNPLFWMVKGRAAEAGVCIHQMEKDFDSGAVFLQQRIPLDPEVTFGLLCTQLAYVGLELTKVFLHGIISGTLKLQEQDHSKARWYGRPRPQDLFIDWNTMRAEDIKALVKACNPWNKGAATRGNGWTFGITEVTVLSSQTPPSALPGTILEMDEQQGLLVSCIESKMIRVDVIYCEEGFFPGSKLKLFGFKKGHQLGK